MKIIRPFVVSDVSLVSSTVSATDPTATAGTWAVGTTYASGAIVQVDSPTFTFTASGNLLTATAHGWLDGEQVQVSSSGTLPTGLTAGVRYYIVQALTNTFKLSLKKGGAPIITTAAGAGTHTVTVSSHKVYESLVGSNVGNTPHKSPTQWLDMGNTNRWKVFDTSITSKCENADSMSYTIQTKGRVDSVALLNTSASETVISAVDQTATVTISNGSPAVITWVGHTFTDGDLVRFTTTGALPTGLSVGTFYYIVNATTNIFNVSLTLSGTPINTSSAGSGVHTGYHLVYGPTTYSLLSSLTVSSFWSWFYEPIVRKVSFVDIDFPPYNNLLVTVTLNDTGNTVGCGAIITGLSKTIGGTQYGASLGIADYSVKSQDDFGNYLVTERAFAKRGNFQVFVDRVATEGVISVLEEYRATPVVYVGSELYDSTIIYGFYRDFSVIIEQHERSICNIEVEGLT